MASSAIAHQHQHQQWILHDPYLNNLGCSSPEDAEAAKLLLLQRPVVQRTQQALEYYYYHHKDLLDETCARWLRDNAQCLAPMQSALAAYLHAKVALKRKPDLQQLQQQPQPQTQAFASVLQPALRLGWLPALCDAFAGYKTCPPPPPDDDDEDEGAYYYYACYTAARDAFYAELMQFCADLDTLRQMMMSHRRPGVFVVTLPFAQRQAAARLQPLVQDIPYICHLSLFPQRLELGRMQRLAARRVRP